MGPGTLLLYSIIVVLTYPAYVLVAGTAESITSADFEVVNSAGIGDRLRSWVEGCCVVQRTMRPVCVVERLELTERTQQVRVVPDVGCGPVARADSSAPSAP